MDRARKLYFIAGEASGDLHAANLMQALLDKDSSLEFKFWGGDKMHKVANKEGSDKPCKGFGKTHQ